jgi:hypothetical protein
LHNFQETNEVPKTVCLNPKLKTKTPGAVFRVREKYIGDILKWTVIFIETQANRQTDGLTYGCIPSPKVL